MVSSVGALRQDRLTTVSTFRSAASSYYRQPELIHSHGSSIVEFDQRRFVDLSRELFDYAFAKLSTLDADRHTITNFDRLVLLGHYHLTFLWLPVNVDRDDIIP